MGTRVFSPISQDADTSLKQASRAALRLPAAGTHIRQAEAFADAIERGVDAQLVLVGDGELRPQLEALIARRGLGERVRITGWMSGADVRQELLAGRALVLPSFAEGLPMVIMEAFALGRPVLSSFVAGIPELVVPGESGWLVPASAVVRLKLDVEAGAYSRGARSLRQLRRELARSDFSSVHEHIGNVFLDVPGVARSL